ncbi:serine/threonine protein kinase [Laceyella putida]|uniref:Serine/threonine protein kinase n=1 Tax=Laceyella putida TaxID=110101 RepID=A0ABW2RH58_9BACL
MTEEDNFTNIILNDLKDIQIQTHDSNILANISYLPPSFTLIGTGTDAIVVRHRLEPKKVYKIFSSDTLHLLEKEHHAYKKLTPSPYFATCYGRDSNFLILSYEPGYTLYECLELGIPIPESVIDEVNQAIQHATNCGLYPKDIHLKNIILQEKHIKLIDLANFLEPGQDQRWDHLVDGYRRFYPFLQGKKIPGYIIEKVKHLYLNGESESCVFDYVQKLLQYLKIK